MKKINETEFKEQLYNLLKYFDALCRENDIQYSLIGGSLIGAVREKKILDWDDDIDVILTRENYIKLQNIIKDTKHDEYTFLSSDNNNTYNFPFMKLVNTKTILNEPRIKNKINNYGIFVDIFYYSYAPNDKCKRRKYFKKIQTYTKFCNKVHLSYDNAHFSRKIARALKNIAITFLGANFFCNKIKKTIEKEDKQSDYVISCWPVYKYEKEIQDAKDINSGYIDADFGPIKAMIFKNYHNILSRTFDNYMEPPRTNNRISHGSTAYWRDEK